MTNYIEAIKIAKKERDETLEEFKEGQKLELNRFTKITNRRVALKIREALDNGATKTECLHALGTKNYATLYEYMLDDIEIPRLPAVIRAFTFGSARVISIKNVDIGSRFVDTEHQTEVYWNATDEDWCVDVNDEIDIWVENQLWFTMDSEVRKVWDESFGTPTETYEATGNP